MGIARAVVAKPALLIADEPTGNLDPELALEIMKLFKRFSEVGVTVVIASHDVHLIDQVGRAAHRLERRTRSPTRVRERAREHCAPISRGTRRSWSARWAASCISRSRP